MDSLKSAVYVSLKRPVTFLMISIITFLCSLLETYLVYQPIEIFLRLNGNLAETVIMLVMSAKAYITKMSIASKAIYLFGGFAGLIAVSIGIAFVISGYFYTLKNVIERRKAYSGEFIEGVGKYFGKVFLAVLKSLLVTIAIGIIILIAAVPALAITNNGFKPSFKFGVAGIAIAIDFITVFMFFFVFMFLRMYVFFYFPSMYLSKSKRVFKTAKRAVDGFFWDIVEKFIAFDIVFILFQLLVFGISVSGVGGDPLTVFCDWVFKLIFFIAFTSYLFRSFKYYNNNFDANGDRNDARMNQNPQNHNQYGRYQVNTNYTRRNSNY